MNYTLEHVGINLGSEEEAYKVAKLFALLFNWPIRDIGAAVFADVEIECMKNPGKGKNGHIAVGTPDVPAAIEDLKAKGFEVDMNTAKYTAEGVLRLVYLVDEIGGFGIHLTKI